MDCYRRHFIELWNVIDPLICIATSTVSGRSTPVLFRDPKAIHKQNESGRDRENTVQGLAWYPFRRFHSRRATSLLGEWSKIHSFHRLEWGRNQEEVIGGLEFSAQRSAPMQYADDTHRSSHCLPSSHGSTFALARFSTYSVKPV